MQSQKKADCKTKKKHILAQKSGQKWAKTYLGDLPRLGKWGKAVVSFRKGCVGREGGIWHAKLKKSGL